MGHLVMDHPHENTGTTDQVRRRNELRADFFSGYILSKFPDATIEKVSKCLSLLDSSTYRPASPEEEEQYAYPILAKRKEAMALGFAGNIKDSLTIEDMQRIKETVIAKGYKLLFKTIDQRLSLQDYTTAIALMDRYLKDNPNTPYKSDLLNLKGIALAKKGNPASAKDNFSKAVSSNPANVAALQNKRDLEEGEKRKKAIEELKKDIKKSGTSGKVNLQD